jgi:hypothetical protein
MEYSAARNSIHPTRFDRPENGNVHEDADSTSKSAGIV